VFINRLGRRLDASARRRRFHRAPDAAGLWALRFHDLRYMCRSLLVAPDVDLASVKAAMGHSRNTRTERYLHARRASEIAERSTRPVDPAGPEFDRCRGWGSRVAGRPVTDRHERRLSRY